ncbi:sec-independent protein translocase protein TatA [Microcella alkaliphila]|uniref:Sec-independent protein translocase protein TatA n=1 Tax=Microcella alkaliphila TaxID=279828 RepID=A0A4Q7TVJ8_9MICO|nr:twin-arginine translocase TatA/TatE family subunit [Microcella alkaliphila]RZT64068.1 sec-independent protein translocase protein TatA [Microcella alkaliphila]
MPQLSGWTGLILLLVILLLFAAPKLPQLAKSLGQSMTIFKKEVKAGKDAEAAEREQTAEGTDAATDGPDSATSK